MPKINFDTKGWRNTAAGVSLVLLMNGFYNAGERRFGSEQEPFIASTFKGMTLDNIVDTGGALKHTANGLDTASGWVSDLFNDDKPNNEVQGAQPAQTELVRVDMPDRQASAVIYLANN